MEASLPSASWRGKGSLGPVSHLLDWERGRFRGLAHWNSASALVSTRSAQVWPSPTPPVSIGAGVSEREGSGTGTSCIGGSLAGVSCGGAAVIPILGPLGPTTGPLAFGPLVRLLLRLAWLQLRPPGQWCPNQMGALLDLASFDQQPVEVAPSLNPEGELQEVV